MQINRWLCLSSSPWGISLHYNLFWKRRVPKNLFFIGTNNWIALVVWWSIKYFFALNLLIFPIRQIEKWEEGEEHTNAKFCASHAKSVI